MVQAHRLKNPKCKLVQDLALYHQSRRVALTGTPLQATPLTSLRPLLPRPSLHPLILLFAVQNDLQELWSLLTFLHPHMFTADACENFEKWFSSPFAGMNVADKVRLLCAVLCCATPPFTNTWLLYGCGVVGCGVAQDKHTAINEEEKLLIIDCLHSFLLPFMLRREKKQVETQLADKIDKVLRCELTPVQRVLYKHITSGKAAMHNRMVQLRKVWCVFSALAILVLHNPVSRNDPRHVL